MLDQGGYKVFWPRIKEGESGYGDLKEKTGIRLSSADAEPAMHPDYRVRFTTSTVMSSEAGASPR